MTNMGANWCCHCGYMLPVGKKNARKCTGSLLTGGSKMYWKLTLERMCSHMSRSVRASGP